MAKKRTKKQIQDNTFDKVKNTIGLIIIITLIVITFMRMGLFGASVDNLSRYIFGNFYHVIYLSLAFYFFDKVIFHKFNLRYYLGLLSLNIAVVLTGCLFIEDGIIGKAVLDNFFAFDLSKLINIDIVNINDGLIGALLYSGLSVLFAKEGTFLITGVLYVIFIMLFIPMEIFKRPFEKAKEKMEERHLKKLQDIENKQINQYEELRPTTSNYNIIADEKKEVVKKFMIEDHNSVKEVDESLREVDTPESMIRYPKRNLRYSLPNLSLLNAVVKNNSLSINRSAAEIKGQRVIEILNSFDIPSELINIHIGPSVTKFEIKPDRGVKISKILGLSNDIKMELAAKSIRIEAPIPGLNAVGIEIPNVESIPVQMIELFKNVPSKMKNSPLLIALGKDLMGHTIFCELNKMPHLLIAGATGSGKSVCMNAIISSLLMRHRPDEVKIMLIDPKRVEFLPYKDIPHLFWPVIDDSNLAANALKRVVAIMEERYELLAKSGVRNLEGYNEKTIEWNKTCSEEEKRELLTYMVVIIDELADLMVVAGKDVETSIQQITQKARAAGIHLIVATQRPSTDVITGVIKANIPSRIAFSVASQVDSRTILDAKGAEDLLGNGDMLYAPIGTLNPIRLQGVFIKDDEINKLTDYCKKQAKPDYEDSYFQLESITSGDMQVINDEISNDPLYDEVVKYIIEVQKCSTSLLQRRFGIGYNRSARIVDTLEKKGLVGPVQGSKPRDVYIKNDEGGEDI